MAEFGSGDSPTPTPSLAHVLVDEIKVGFRNRSVAKQTPTLVKDIESSQEKHMEYKSPDPLQ